MKVKNWGECWGPGSNRNHMVSTSNRKIIWNVWRVTCKRKRFRLLKNQGQHREATRSKWSLSTPEGNEDRSEWNAKSGSTMSQHLIQILGKSGHKTNSTSSRIHAPAEFSKIQNVWPDVMKMDEPVLQRVWIKFLYGVFIHNPIGKRKTTRKQLKPKNRWSMKWRHICTVIMTWTAHLPVAHLQKGGLKMFGHHCAQKVRHSRSARCHPQKSNGHRRSKARKQHSWIDLCNRARGRSSWHRWKSDTAHCPKFGAARIKATHPDRP